MPAPEPLGQRVAHPLHQAHIHAVVEKHVHVDDVPFAYYRLTQNPSL